MNTEARRELGEKNAELTIAKLIRLDSDLLTESRSGFGRGRGTGSEFLVLFSVYRNIVNT
jgi:hypothetical protein